MDTQNPAQQAHPAQPKGKKIHPILLLPERFHGLSVQFGKEPELEQISLNGHNNHSPADFTGLAAQHGADTGLNERPFRLYDLVKLDPDIFWQLYRAQAYNDLLLRLTYERYLPNNKKGLTNYIETVHLTGTSFEPAKSNGLEYWHQIEDGEDNGVLELHFDPANPRDPFAIAVHTQEAKRIGWIPAKEGINQLVTRNHNLGCFISAQLLRVESGSIANGVAIHIAIGWQFPAHILTKYTQTPQN